MAPQLIPFKAVAMIRLSLVLGVLLAVVQTTPAAPRQAGGVEAGPAAVSRVLNVAFEGYRLPAFIEALASELEAGIGNHEEKRQRLETKVRELFSADEVEKRLNIVRQGSIDHTWSDGFSDLSGTYWTPPVAQVVGPTSAVVTARRFHVTHHVISRESDISDLYRRFPVTNVGPDEVRRRLETVPWQEVVVFVTWRSLDTMDLVREGDTWKIERVTSQPDMAYALIVDG